MISDAFILLGLAITKLFFDILPVGTGYPSYITNSFSTIGEIAGVVNSFVPLEAVGLVFVIYYGYDLTIFAFKQIVWIFSKIPLIGK